MFRDLIVVIPGILGSRLERVEGGKRRVVWDLSLRGLGPSLRSLATEEIVFSHTGGVPDDGVVATDLFSFQLLPGFVGVDDYAQLLHRLRSKLARPEQLLTFPYDWRASNRHSAQRLADAALAALLHWKASSGHRDAKLWLVCHSMGGLVARYFCEHLGGARYTRAIVSYGTPYRGAAKALRVLANGLNIGPVDLTRIVRSLPSVHELLPLYPAIQGEALPGEQAVYRLAELYGLHPQTGEDLTSAPTDRELKGIDRSKLVQALRFHDSIRSPAERRQAEGEPPLYEQRVFYNRRQRTETSARLVGSRLVMQSELLQTSSAGLTKSELYGDGTVPSFSCLPIEWEHSGDAVPITSRHATMQSDEAAGRMLENWLDPVDSSGLKGHWALDSHALSLDVPQVTAAGAAFHVHVTSPYRSALTVSLEHIDSDARHVKKVKALDAHATCCVEFELDKPGVWQVFVRPDRNYLPTVSDLIFAYATS